MGLAGVVLVCCRGTAVPLIGTVGKVGCDDELDAVGGDSSGIETGEGDSRSQDTVLICWQPKCQ